MNTEHTYGNYKKPAENLVRLSVSWQEFHPCVLSTYLNIYVPNKQANEKYLNTFCWNRKNLSILKYNTVMTLFLCFSNLRLVS